MQRQGQACVPAHCTCRAYDAQTWQFPELTGTVRCRGLDLHFWDAPDDLHAVRVDLLFERTRVYLHNARGYYGAAPLTVTGAQQNLRLCPRVLSACVWP